MHIDKLRQLCLFSGLNLPSAVFASQKEENIGLLNKAAPRSGPLIDWDPDIVETLDDDFKTFEAVFTLKQAELDEQDGDIEDELDILLAEANDEEGDEDGDDDAGKSDSDGDSDRPSLQGR